MTMEDSRETSAAEARGPAGGWLLPVAIVVGGPVAVFGPMLARGEVLYWGTPLLQFVPWRRLAFGLIRAGIAPLWNPYLGMGAPLLANHQSAILYPPNWLGALLPVGWADTLLVFFHLILAGVGTVAFLRHLRLSQLGQVVGGLSFASGSYLVARAGFPSLIAVASWLPWLLLAADRLSTEGRSRHFRHAWIDAGAVGLILGLMAVAGHAQTLAYSAILTVAWSFFRSRVRSGRRSVTRLAGLWLAAAAFGVGLAAIQLLPTAEYFLQSSRGGGLEEASALTYSFWPWRSLGLLLPGLFGSPAIGDYWGYGNYWEDALYIGVLPLLMAIAGAAGASRLGREQGRLRWFLLSAASVSFFLSLGSNTSVSTFLFRNAPFFDVFNAPTRLNLVTTWSLAVLAAFGADLWKRPSGRGLYWARLGTAGAFAVLAIGTAAMLAPVPLRPSLGRAFAVAGSWLLLAGAVSLAWPEVPRRGWTVLIGAMIVADLGFAHHGLIPSTSSDVYHGETQLARELGRDHRVYLASAAERELKFEKTHRFESFQPELDPKWIRESGLPNVLLLDRVPSADNFDPLVPGRYADWIEMLDGLTPERRADLLRLMDVGWTASEVSDEPPWVEYEAVPGASRARIVPRAIGAGTLHEALTIVADPGFSPSTMVVLEGAGSDLDRAGGQGSVEILPGPDPGRIDMKVEAPAGGWLVLSDIWYPGWGVEVDGVPAPVFPADGAFRAVWLPPGANSVAWIYRSTVVQAGAWISVASLLGGVGGWWIARRRSG